MLIWTSSVYIPLDAFILSFLFDVVHVLDATRRKSSHYFNGKFSRDLKPWMCTSTSFRALRTWMSQLWRSETCQHDHRIVDRAWVTTVYEVIYPFKNFTKARHRPHVFGNFEQILWQLCFCVILVRFFTDKCNALHWLRWHRIWPPLNYTLCNMII